VEDVNHMRRLPEVMGTLQLVKYSQTREKKYFMPALRRCQATPTRKFLGNTNLSFLSETRIILSLLIYYLTKHNLNYLQDRYEGIKESLF